MFRNGINNKKWDLFSEMELMYSFYEKGRTQYFQAMKVEGRTLFETNPQMAKN